MRPPSRLPRIGAATYRASAPKAPANVCVFCLQQTRLPFSTSTPRSVDTKLQYRRAQTARQKRYEEVNAVQLTPEQLKPRIEHELNEKWRRVIRQARRNGEQPPEKSRWLADLAKQKRATESKMSSKEKQALRMWQASIDEATKHIETPRASTWDGMEMVGGETEWNTGLVFESFLPQTKLSSNDDITAAMYRTVVEVFTAVAHGDNPASISQSSNLYGSIYDDIKEVQITISKQEGQDGGAIKLQYPNEEIESRIHRTIIPQDDAEVENVEAEDTNTAEPSHSQPALAEHITTWGTQWHSVAITDPSIKLAIVKRLTSLLGTPIPDPTIHAHHTVGSLLSELVKPPPPKKIHDALLSNDVLAELPNLSLRDRRLSLVEKETTIGRWKVIRNELRQKGLPVLKGVTGWEFERPKREKAVIDTEA